MFRVFTAVVPAVTLLTLMALRTLTALKAVITLITLITLIAHITLNNPLRAAGWSMWMAAITLCVRPTTHTHTNTHL